MTIEQAELKTSQEQIAPRLDLPEAICFRVTRYCNASCGFCLAPNDGAHPNAGTLTERLDWLLSRGVRSIHFCGGEPTIHPALSHLIEHVQRQGGKSRLTTNGIVVPNELISVLRSARTHVKVSLHGDREHHDKIVGRTAFDHTIGNIRRLLAAGVPTSVQTTIVSGGEWVVEWVVAFCRELGVRRLSILPFIPRGNGYIRRREYELTIGQRRSLRNLVSHKRKMFSGRLDIRWLDFTAQPIYVVEADGTVVLEGVTEASDQIVHRIPCGITPN